MLGAKFPTTHSDGIHGKAPQRIVPLTLPPSTKGQHPGLCDYNEFKLLCISCRARGALLSPEIFSSTNATHWLRNG